MSRVKLLYILTEPLLPLIRPETFALHHHVKKEHVLRYTCDLGMTPGLHLAHLESKACWEVGNRWAGDTPECRGWFLPGLLSVLAWLSGPDPGVGEPEEGSRCRAQGRKGEVELGSASSF